MKKKKQKEMKELLKQLDGITIEIKFNKEKK
jgi:hypothetical protein